MEIKRLFDSVAYQLQHFPKTDMFGYKQNGEWKTVSTQETQITVNNLSAGLLQLGVSGNNFTAEGSDKIAIISNNRPEWVFTDLAVQQIGAILVPVYPTTNPLELEFIFNDAKVKYVFVSSADLLEKINALKDKVPSIQNIYTFEHIDGATHWSAVTGLANAESLQQVETLKKQIPVEHTATIIYTSGTTGTPKGVMLSHSNIYSCLKLSRDSFPFEDAPQNKALSFLPLNHIFEKSSLIFICIVVLVFIMPRV